MRDQFLKGAAVVLEAVGSAEVAESWNEPSVLAGQTVGGLAGHLARGSVWVVLDYLDATGPGESHHGGDTAVHYETAAQYFAEVVEMVGDADHAAIRERGAKLAEQGHGSIVSQLTERLGALQLRLPNEPPGRTLAVFAGKVMRLDDYLLTRVVEQVVHLDDLARSLEREPWTNPPDADALVVACGAEVGRLRHGSPTMIRTLFRDHPSGVPVL
jgi:hypothetical protein